MVTAEKVNNRMAKKNTSTTTESSKRSKKASAPGNGKAAAKKADGLVEQNSVLKTTLQQIERQLREVIHLG